jgi:hypothetical protein
MLKLQVVYNQQSRRGGTGRRARLKIVFHSGVWVRSPPPAGFRDPKESAVKLNGNAKQLNLETRAEACLAGEVRKCLSTDRTVRRGKAVGKIAILNDSRPFLLALAQFTPSR